MNNHLERIQHYRVTPFVVGLEVGRALGARIEQTIDTYIAGRAYARGSDPHPGDGIRQCSLSGQRQTLVYLWRLAWPWIT